MPPPPHHPTSREDNLHPHDRKNTAVMGISISHMRNQSQGKSSRGTDLLSPLRFKNIFRTPPKFPRNSQSSTCKATCFKLNFVLRLYSREILHINVFLNKFFNPP